MGPHVFLVQLRRGRQLSYVGNGGMEVMDSAQARQFETLVEAREELGERLLLPDVDGAELEIVTL